MLVRKGYYAYAAAVFFLLLLLSLLSSFACVFCVTNMSRTNGHVECA